MILDNKIGTFLKTDYNIETNNTFTENHNYTYKLLALEPNKELVIKQDYQYFYPINSFDSFINFNIEDKKYQLFANQGLEVCAHRPVKLHSKKKTNLLYCGKNLHSEEKNNFETVLYKDFYNVSKPWGKELWLNGENKPLSFKKIIINEGFQTSLQYHNLKFETNLLINGKIEFYFSDTVASSFSNNKTLKKMIVNETSCMQIDSNNIHRIKALTNTVLFEVSTPHLDDVIRVSDDTNRTSGRIQSEHS